MKKKRDFDGIFCHSFLVISLISSLRAKLGTKSRRATFKASGCNGVVESRNK